MRAWRSIERQHGASMVEVLVTMVITAIGLLGLAALQGRMQAAEMEAYQRSQALVLLEDMASRITSNRVAAATYVTAAPLGAGMTCPTAPATRQEIDSLQWCHALQGAAELVETNKVGAMIGARGCVDELPDNEYLVTVAWQGLVPLSAPPASVTCGQNLYDGGPDSPCQEDRCRRVVTTIVRIGTLAP